MASSSSSPSRITGRIPGLVPGAKASRRGQVSQRREGDDDARTNGQVRRRDASRGERTRGRDAPQRADRTASRHRTPTACSSRMLGDGHVRFLGGPGRSNAPRPIRHEEGWCSLPQPAGNSAGHPRAHSLGANSSAGWARAGSKPVRCPEEGVSAHQLMDAAGRRRGLADRAAAERPIARRRAVSL
jgi:hypothetical protein